MGGYGEKDMFVLSDNARQSSGVGADSDLWEVLVKGKVAVAHEMGLRAQFGYKHDKCTW